MQWVLTNSDPMKCPERALSVADPFRVPERNPNGWRRHEEADQTKRSGDVWGRVDIIDGLELFSEGLKAGRASPMKERHRGHGQAKLQGVTVHGSRARAELDASRPHIE